jgi:L-ascorbate metabolism protein UlaG (beta-lactamase superfamily)
MRPDRLTWIGHSTVALDLGGARVLTDPLLRPRLLHLRRHGPAPHPDVVRDVDVILVSHLHYDHLDVPSLRLLGSATPIVVPRGAAAFLRRRGFGDVLEVGAGDEVVAGGVRILAVPAEHERTRRPGGPEADPLGYVVGAQRRVYFAGDTALFAGLADIGALGLDVALLPIWGWGPTIGPGHMDPPDAARAAAVLQPALAVPIHWGTFFPRGLAALRGGSLVAPPKAFLAAAASMAPSVPVRVLRPGEALPLPSGSREPVGGRRPIGPAS